MATFQHDPFPEGSANQALFDAMVRHQIDLLRLSKSVRNKVIALLNASEQEIATTIRERLRDSTGFEKARLEKVMEIITRLREAAFEDATQSWQDDFVALAQAEPELVAQQLKTVSPTILDMTIPPVSALKVIATSTPFEGRVLKDWAKRLMKDDLVRIQHAIRTGMVNGEASDVIARRVVGTARLKGADGVTQITRNNADSITRTALMTIAQQVRSLLFKENSDIISKELYVATLDSRTTPFCRAHDGKVYDVGKGPHPPAHWNCRSIRIPVLDPDALQNRPFKAATEQRLLREWAAKTGTPLVKSRDALPYGTKGKFDAWAQGRIRELTGTVSADTDYGTWLGTQPASVQDDILGKTRGALFRRGGLTLDRFINRNGDELTLGELADRQAQAFRDAGLNPDDF